MTRIIAALLALTAAPALAQHQDHGDHSQMNHGDHGQMDHGDHGQMDHGGHQDPQTGAEEAESTD